MHSTTTRIVLALALLTASPCLQAQDLFASLKEMRARYADSDRLHITMDIRAYESDAATTPFFRQQAEVMKAGDDYRYRYENREVLLNERVSLVIDNQHRVMTCQLRDKQAEDIIGTLPFADLDSLLSVYGTSSFEGEHQGLAHYEIARDQGDIERIGLFLDTQVLLMRKIEYHYRNGSRVAIDFSTMKINPVFEPNTFSEKQYVTRVRRAWHPTEAYAHYQIAQ